MRAVSDAREIAGLVPMARLLAALGFAVNERTRRCACLLHGGSNQTALSWREDGRWHCHSCGRGGDKITLVREARSCSFRDAVVFLAALAGVDYRERRVSAQDIKRARERRQRAEGAAWRIRDEGLRLRRQYTEALHRCERLQSRTGEKLLRARTDAEREVAWERLARLAPAATFLLAAWRVVLEGAPETVASFALATPGERRTMILGGDFDERIVTA